MAGFDFTVNLGFFLTVKKRTVKSKNNREVQNFDFTVKKRTVKSKSNREVQNFDFTVKKRTVKCKKKSQINREVEAGSEKLTVKYVYPFFF